MLGDICKKDFEKYFRSKCFFFIQTIKLVSRVLHPGYLNIGVLHFNIAVKIAICVRHFKRDPSWFINIKEAE